MSMTASDQAAGARLRQDAGVIALVGLAHAASHFGHLLLAPLFAVFMTEFGLSFAQLGALVSVFFLLSGLGQAVSGFVVDRFGARPLLFASLSGFVLACLLAATVTGYPGLLVVAAMAGLSNATFHPVDFTILNQRVAPARIGFAFSVHSLTGYLGWAAAPVFFATLNLWLGWRGAYLAAACGFAGVLAVMFWQSAQLGTKVFPSAFAGMPEHVLAFMKLPVVWGCFAFFFLSTMTLAVIQSFSVPIFKVLYAVSFETANLTLTAYMVCAALGVFAGGFVAANFKHSERVVALLMTGAALLLGLSASRWLGATLAMTVFATTGFALGMAAPARDMMIKNVTPKGATGRVYGLVYSGLDAGFALSPLLFGVLMDRGWYATTLLGAAALLLLSVLAALAVGRRPAA